MKINYILFIPIFFTVGCSTISGSNPLYSPHGGNERGMPIHGNFCGQNIPTVRITTREATINELLRIPAIDVVDQACKNHDICYVYNYNNKLGCDNFLVMKMDEYLVRKSSTCYHLAVAISGFFRGKTLHSTQRMIMGYENKGHSEALNSIKGKFKGEINDKHDFILDIPVSAGIDLTTSTFYMLQSGIGYASFLSILPHKTGRYHRCF